MGWWDYTNIGASASRQNQKYVEKIFEYMGYSSIEDYSEDGAECTFDRPAVYYCMRSENPAIKEQIREIKELKYYGVKALRDLLNALFPGTFIYLHSASGSITSPEWENHDEVYNTSDITCYRTDTYTYRKDRSWKERFILESPPMEYVQALIRMSTDDGNTELTSLLLELEQNLRAKPVSVDVKRVSSEAEWIAAFGEYVEKDPQIEFKGKIFVFDLHADSSFSVKEALYDRGGIIRQSVSSKTDYLVTRLAWYALATLRKAIELKKNGCKIKIVLQEDFDAAVNRTPIIAQEGYNVAEDGTLELRGETMIRSKAFRSNKELKMIRIPKGVTYINKNAFEGCENLKTVVLPKTLISIAEYAFWRCASLESVTFNERLRRIGRNAFQSCASLESVTFNEGLEKIDDSAFQGCTSLESATFNEGLRTIGMNAFQDCTSLESATFNEGLRTIGMNAFQDCTSLESVTFNEGLSEIGSKAFQDCTSLKSVTFNKGLRRIGTLAFWDCTSLESITFNGGWETIDEHAFRGCELLKSVTMLVSEENPLTTWLKDVSPYNFSTSKAVLHIPKSLCGWAMENGIEKKFDRIEYLS